MRNWILLIGSVVCVGLVLVGATTARQLLLKDAESEDQKHFIPENLLVVDKTVVLGIDGNDVEAKVLEKARGSWIKAEVQDRGKAVVVWVNLRRVSYIMPEPAKDRGPNACQPPGGVPAF